MEISGKIWGRTKTVLSTPTFEFHEIVVEKSGTCSKHKHEHKWNAFYVNTGCLCIRVWKNNYNLVDTTYLHPGEMLKVKPGEYHQFEALEHTTAMEMYWTEFDRDDIIRETVGSINPQEKQ